MKMIVFVISVDGFSIRNISIVVFLRIEYYPCVCVTTRLWKERFLPFSSLWSKFQNSPIYILRRVSNFNTRNPEWGKNCDINGKCSIVWVAVSQVQRFGVRHWNYNAKSSWKWNEELVSVSTMTKRRSEW